MKILGYDISIEKKRGIPANVVGTSPMTDEAARLAGTRQMTIPQTAPPAAGARPEPGPLPMAPTATSEEQRHQPMRWQIPYAYNQLWTPRRQYTPFATLRQLADIDDIMRICIETRKDQMCSLGWDIAPRDKKNNQDAAKRKVEELRAFYRRPDKRRPFSTWLRTAIEDILVVDALSIYRRRTRGGQIYALELKDGATFLPLLDESGDTPMAPAVAYRQIINGAPVAGGDCSVDDLYYRPRTVRTWTPYGLSPVEAVLLTVNAALNREMFNLQYYTDGNIPEGLLEAPEGFTTKQLIEFQDYLDDYLSGDLGKRRRVKAVHSGGSKVFQFKEPDFATMYDEWLLKVRCAAFAVPPQEIGFTGDVNKATGQMQENVVYRRGVKPLGGFLKEIFDESIEEDHQAPDFEWVWTGGEPEDKKLQADVDKVYVDMGKVSVDDLRIRDGQEPIGMGPYVMSAMGPVFVEELLNAPPDDDPNTSEVDSPGAPANTGGDPNNSGQPTPASGDGSDEVTNATMADLRKWRAVAIKCVKANKPIREFASEAIPFELHVRVVQFLKAAERTGNLGTVVAAFDLALEDYHQVKKAGAEARQLTRGEQRAAKAYQRLMKLHFRKQAGALVDHLKKGLSS